MSPLASRVAWATLIAFQLAHLFLRDSAWVLDVRWASSQYLFSIILFGPALSGIAAEQGRQAAKSNWILRSSPIQGTLAWLSAPLRIGLTVFLGGWVSVIFIALVNGATWTLTLATLLNLFSATIGVAALAAVGFALGTLWGHRLVAALAVLVTFAVMVVGWTGANPSLVWFGGAPAGVAGAEQSTSATLLRICFSVLVIAIAAFITVRRAGLTPPSVGFASLLIVTLIVAMLATQTQPIKIGPISWKCDSGVVEVCVPAQYERTMPAVSSWIDSSQVVKALAASNNVSTVLRIDDELLLANVNKYGVDNAEVKERLSVTLARLFAPNCFQLEDSPALNEEQSVAFGKLSGWVDHEVMGRQLLLDQYGIDDVSILGIPDSPIGTPEVTQFLHQNLELLPPCPR